MVKGESVAPESMTSAAGGLTWNVRLSGALAWLSAPFAKIAALHRSVVAALSADATGVPAAFQGRDGTALETAFEEIAANAHHADFADAEDIAQSCVIVLM